MALARLSVSIEDDLRALGLVQGADAHAARLAVPERPDAELLRRGRRASQAKQRRASRSQESDGLLESVRERRAGPRRPPQGAEEVAPLLRDILRTVCRSDPRADRPKSRALVPASPPPRRREAEAASANASLYARTVLGGAGNSMSMEPLDPSVGPEAFLAALELESAAQDQTA